MKYNIFDVIELNNKQKAIIVNIINNLYYVKIITENNENILMHIKENDIKRILYKKKN